MTDTETAIIQALRGVTNITSRRIKGGVRLSVDFGRSGQEERLFRLLLANSNIQTERE